MAFEDWSTTAGNNVLANIGLKFDEGWFPSEVNNYLRAMVAQIATAQGNYPGIGFKNKIINGGMEVWQRGDGAAASIAVAASTTAYTADRWYITTGSNQASVISQQAGLTNGSRYCARVQRNSGQTGTGAIVFCSPLTTSMLAPLRGVKVAISASVRSGANWSPTSGNLTMSFYVGTGAEAKRGGGFTSETTVATATSALGTSSSVTTMTAVSAAVVPTNTAQGELRFTWTPVGTASTSDYVEIDEVQIELGTVASPFDRRPFADELAHCQRYYQKTFSYDVAPSQNNTGIDAISGIAGKAGATSQFITWTYKVDMRINPTVTFYNPSATNAQVRDVTAGADCSSTAISGGTAGKKNLVVTATGNASTAVGNLLEIQASADADL